MQNSRIARLMEEAYFQDAVFTLDILSLLTNISLDSLRDRLKQWNSADINLCISGQSIKSRGSLLRASYLITSFLKGEDLLSIRKFLCYSEDTANHLLINFVRLYSGLRDGLPPTRISATATVNHHIIEQWCSLIGEFEKLYPKNLSMLEDYFKIQATSTVKIDNFQETHSNKYREQIPVILTIYTPDEIHAIKSNIHNLTLNFINDILQQQIARVTSEAYLQGGLLSQLDLQMFFYRSHGIISKQIVEYEEKHKVILPTPGTIKDAGRRFTHKRIVISLYLEGYLSKDIAVKTHHSGIAVDRYIDGFLRVMALHLYSVPPEVMSRTLKFSVNLVNEYISIVKEHFPNRDAMISHLREHGVEIG